MNKKSIDDHFNLANYYYTQGNLNEAITQFENIAALNPREYTVFQNLGVLNYLLGNLKGAEKNFKKAISHDHNSTEALYGLGNVFLKQRKVFLAITAFLRCLNIDLLMDKAKKRLDECYITLNENLLKEVVREQLKGFMLSACFDKVQEASRLRDAKYQLSIVEKYIKPENYLM
ncbi:MAG: tetratricopeptide repeat protein [Candidatus Kuenenia sp.]|nr:tetratricopeptide repeat protein [Candidatus Kuenenia hertensis]